MLVISYRRPQGTERVLRNAIVNGATQLYVAIDSPEQPDLDLIADFDRRIENLKIEFSVNIKVWKRYTRFGLAKSVITAIDWFFEFEEQGIILEDDLRINPTFYDYIAQKISLLYIHEDIWIISGNNFFPELDDLFANYPLIWGWATTREKWKLMAEEMLRDESDLRGIPEPSIRQFWRIGKIRVKKGKVDSWAILLAATMKNNSKICLIPPRNLISNIGSDSSATHTIRKNWVIDFPTHDWSENEIQGREQDFSNSEMNRKLEKEIYEIKPWTLRRATQSTLLRMKSRNRLKELRDARTSRLWES